MKRCARSSTTSRRRWTGAATILRGGERAAVTLVEYADDGCPYSRMPVRAIQRLEQQLGSQLRFVFRHLPLTTRFHPHALTAAHLAEAAALQGHFWPVHELLFHHQKALQDPDLLRYADQLGLDRRRLEVDLDSQTVWPRVQADADSALTTAIKERRRWRSAPTWTRSSSPSRLDR